MLPPPLVAHFREEHGGIAQEILMRILSTHLTPLDRQVKESLNIFKASGNPDKCLNMKSEWGGAKLPNLQVSTPKGTASGKHRTGQEDKEGIQEMVNQEKKRIHDHQGSTKEVQETEPGKRMREKSPEAETLRWRTRPTFLAVRGKETGQENQTHDETQGKQSGKTKETTEMVADRTPVKERIRKLKKKAKSSPGKFPGRKQAMVSEYFKRYTIRL